MNVGWAKCRAQNIKNHQTHTACAQHPMLGSITKCWARRNLFTRFKQTSKRAFAQPTLLIRKFDQSVYSWLSSVGAKEQENESLAKLRDTLLPKLLSGELPIPDAEKLVEEAMA